MQTIIPGASISDPAAQNSKAIIRRGKFWKQGARSGGGFQPAANHSVGIGQEGMEKLFHERQKVKQKALGAAVPHEHGGAVMDWMEGQKGQRLSGGVVNPVNSLALNTGQGFVGYVGSPNVTTTSGSVTTGSVTTPKVTYSNTAISKSYSPASIQGLGKK